MLGKAIAACLATLIIIIFGLFPMWGALQEGITAANTSYTAAGNFTSTVQAIRFTGLALWLGVLSIPVVVIILIAWARRYGYLV